MIRSRYWTGLVCILVLFAPVNDASSQQNEDTKAILDAVKALGQRMDSMQRQIDQLRAGSAPAAAGSSGNATPSVATPTAAVPPGMNPEGGWVVSALPSINGQREPDALFRFSRSRLPMTFNAHLGTRAIDDWVKYRGDAQLQVFEPGRHVFSIEIKAPDVRYGGRTYCGGYLRIGKSQLINIGDEDSGKDNERTLISPKETKTLSAGINLEAGNHDIAFLVACHSGCSVSGDANCRGYWHSTSFDILLRGPQDDALRPPLPKEIIHMVRQRPAAVNTSSPSPTQQTPGWSASTSPAPKATAPKSHPVQLPR